MKALDTNVLVRFLVKDDAEQAQQVYKLFKQAENHQQRLFVPILVVLETIWVLQAVYGVDDQDILAVMNDLLLMPVLLFKLSRFCIHLLRRQREITSTLRIC